MAAKRKKSVNTKAKSKAKAKKAPAKKPAKKSAKNPAKKKVVSKTKAKVKVPSKTKAKVKAIAKTKAKAKIKAKAKPTAKTKAKSTAKPKAKSTAKPKAKSTAKPKAKSTAKPKAKTKKVPVKKTTAASKAKATTAKKAASKSKTDAKKKPVAEPVDSKKVPRLPAPRPRSVSSEPTFEPYKAQRNEEYMNEEQHAHFREILLQWKSQLMEEVDRTVNHMKDEAANYPDPADRASQEEEFSLELKTRDRERKLIRKIDKTLELIDQDEYGYCESCGIEIGVQRLEARPTATQCIDCKTLEEIKERQIHG